VLGSRDWDANWLVLTGSLLLPDGRAHAFRDPCLTTWEARELSDWLRSVAAGDVTSSPDDADEPLDVVFTEPCIAFDLERADADLITLRVYLSLEAEPPFAVDGHPGVFSNYVRMVMSPEDLEAAASHWRTEIAAFSIR
jgi:hypothetical protein